MDADALLIEYRRRANDQSEPYHTSDEEALRFATEAVREASMRSLLLFDTATPEVVEYAVAVGQAEVSLSPLVLKIDAATFEIEAGRAFALYVTGLDALRENCDWLSGRGRPRSLAHMERNIARLYPIPSQAGTLRLAVYRLPLTSLESRFDEPEIAAEHHDGLIDWMLYRTWIAKDSEQEDPQRAATALRDFTNRFGERASAGVMRKHRERRRVTTRYGG